MAAPNCGLPAALYNVAWRATPAGSQQPAASSQQPAASSQQPAASSQQPAASSQQARWGRPRQHQGSSSPKDFTALLAIMFHSVPPSTGSPPACPPFLQPQSAGCWLVGPGPAAWLAASPVPVCCQVSHRVGKRPGGESPPPALVSRPGQPSCMHGAPAGAAGPSQRRGAQPAQLQRSPQ